MGRYGVRGRGQPLATRAAVSVSYLPLCVSELRIAFQAHTMLSAWHLRRRTSVVLFVAVVVLPARPS